MLEQTTLKVLAMPALKVVEVPPDAGVEHVVVGPVTVSVQVPEVTVAVLFASLATKLAV